MQRDLVQRAQTGDHDAFAELARDALDRLYGTARLVLIDQGRAEAAARDALIVAWREIRRLPDPDGFGPWLHGILARSAERTDHVDARASTVEVDDSRQAFEGLSGDHRTILALVYFAGLTVVETSFALGIPSATAEARLHGAFDALRSALDVDDTANARVDLEWRLRSWLAQEAAPPDLTAILDAVIAGTRSAPQRGRGFGRSRRPRTDDRGARRVTGRRLGVALVTAAALVVVVVGGLAVTRVLRPGDEKEGQIKARPAGAISSTADISVQAGGLYQPAVAVLTDGRVLVVGLGNVLLGGVVYDPATGTYGDPIRDQVLRRGSTATTLQNSLVLLTGGTFDGSESASATAVLFDPYSKTFATTNELSVARTEHTATLLDDGRVLVVGGRTRTFGDGPQLVAEQTVEVYDPATGTFGTTGSMARARAGHTATKLRDGRVLIAGGFTESEAGQAMLPSEAEIFDPATGQFRPTGAMNVARSYHSATLLADGRVLIVGGMDRVPTEQEIPHSIPFAEVFDPVTARFAAVGSLVTERAGHSATLLTDGRVLVAGGQNEIGEPRSTEIFDPSTGGFAPGPRAGAPHHATQAPLVAGGRVLLTGSGPGASEVFDGTADGIAVAPSMTPRSGAFRSVGAGVMRTYPVLVELGDGRVLILGGWAPVNGEPIVEAEIFDPTTGQMSAAGTLLHPLSGTATTRLPDGRIFIVGDAFDGTGVGEIFDPAAGSFGPASEATDRVLSAYHPFATPGLPDGRLLLTDGVDKVFVLDAATGVVGAPIGVCESPQSPIAIDDDRVLVGCGENGAFVADLTAGTSEPTAFAFDRAVRLDARRTALVLGSWHFGETVGGWPLLDRVTAIYDALDQSVQPVPIRTDIGSTVVVSGDRILAFGGRLTDGSSSGESVSIDTHSWKSTGLGQMLAARSEASALVLKDGRVLIVGGGVQSPDRTDPLPPTAEIFDPSLVP